MLDSFGRIQLYAFALEKNGLRLDVEAIPEKRRFTLTFPILWAFEFEDEFFGSMAEDLIDTSVGSLAVSTDTQRVRNFREACAKSFPEHIKDLREYRVRATSEIAHVVCQGPCDIAEIAS